MPLDADRLGLAIKAAIDACEDHCDREEVFCAIADAIVTEFLNNAQVNFPQSGPSMVTATTVTPGVGVSGPLTGKGTVS
jgi:hypothetical protein